MIIIATDKAKHMKEGTEYNVSKETGELLISKKWAYEKGKAPKKEAAKKATEEKKTTTKKKK